MDDNSDEHFIVMQSAIESNKQYMIGSNKQYMKSNKQESDEKMMNLSE